MGDITRAIRMGMVGGGVGAFIGGVHRMAARLDGSMALVAGALSSRRDTDPLFESAGSSGSSSVLQGSAAREGFAQLRTTQPGYFSKKVMENMLREMAPSAATALSPPGQQLPDPLAYFREHGAYAGVDAPAPALGLIQYTLLTALRSLWEGRTL